LGHFDFDGLATGIALNCRRVGEENCAVSDNVGGKLHESALSNPNRRSKHWSYLEGCNSILFKHKRRFRKIIENRRGSEAGCREEICFAALASLSAERSEGGRPTRQILKLSTHIQPDTLQIVDLHIR
jgi:hypothetical protein